MINLFKKKTKKSTDLDLIDRTPKAVNKNLSDIEFLESEIKLWKNSTQRNAMIIGENYYLGVHDILKRKRTAIGEDGKVIEVENLPNNRIVDNQYAKMVDQKTNYLLGQPLTFDTKDKAYEDVLSEVFNKSFHRTLKNLGENSLNCGIAWLYPYFNEKGDLSFRRFEPYEVLPFWADAAHTTLDMLVRVYEVEVYETTEPTIKEKVEVYYPDRVEKYDYTDERLVPDADDPVSDYVVFEDESGSTQGYSWGKVPVIAFKYNNREVPLITKTKSLQDAINLMLSDFANNMQEDSRNTILIIKNYDGQNLGEFRHNLATYGAVKVKTVDGADGGVEALTIAVNSDNYKSILELLKKSLIENAMGYDAKDDRLSGNPNQMNLLSMYNDIDLDANNMETEYQAAFEELLGLLNRHFVNKGFGDFSYKDVRIIFNRDMMMNESEVIENCAKSVGIISDATIVSMHPWIEDVDGELEKIKKQKEEADAYDPFVNPEDSDEPKAGEKP